MNEASEAGPGVLLRECKTEIQDGVDWYSRTHFKPEFVAGFVRIHGKFEASQLQRRVLKLLPVS